MRSSLRLGKVWGITINLHYSWFLIFALITSLLCFSFLQDYHLWVRVIASIGASLSLFASVMAHELAHSFVAIKSGIPVKSITLFFLGGVAHITREATRPMIELRMAIAGPLCSLMLAVIFGLIWFLIWGNTQPTFDFDNFDNPVFWLAWSNLVLALFNLAPGFPLDGGRILRALLWQGTGNYRRATHIASLVGKGIASLAVGGGVVIFFGSIFTTVLDAPFFGIWLVFIGWFLHTAATTTSRQVEMREALRGFTVQAVMSTDYVSVPPDLSLRKLVQGYVLPGSRRYFVVAEEGRLKGLITFEDIKKVPQTQWDTTPVRVTMTPADKIVSAQPGEEALSILERMEGQSINQIPVIREGVVIGIVVREDLLRFIRLRSELKV